MTKYKLMPLDKQDKLKKGLVRLVEGGYLPINKIVMHHIAGGATPFLPLEEQDMLDKGLLKYRDTIAERNLYGIKIVRFFKAIFGGPSYFSEIEYRYKPIDNLEIKKFPFSRKTKK